MKISKIFHWLYASIMFAPIFAVLVSCLYIVFNKNAIAPTNYNIYDMFYYAVSEVNTMSLFSWARNTFLAQPILYITDLFNMPSNHEVITLLCYWLSISIIWLVFDLIMYVPLLVHRWLDKGVIE